MSGESLFEWGDGLLEWGDRPPRKITFSEYGSLSNTVPAVPADPTMQRIAAEVRAQKEAEKNTPENLRIAAEAKLADRAEKKHNFHFGRALPHHMMEGWKLIGGNRTDEEIRVYTRTYDWKHRFWGVKPVGMTMYDFWEIHDPEITRHHDAQQEYPLDPQEPLGPLINEPAKDLPSSARTARKPERRRKTPEINPIHRVRKSNAVSPKVDKNTRKSIADISEADQSGLEGGQMREVMVTAHSNGGAVQTKTTGTTSSGQQKQATGDGGSDAIKLPRGRPAIKAKAATKDDSSQPKRPRGRPPGKGQLTEIPSKQKKTPVVKGNSRVIKSPQTERRPPAPSTHKMRTRGKGRAELLQLP